MSEWSKILTGFLFSHLTYYFILKLLFLSFVKLRSRWIIGRSLPKETKLTDRKRYHGAAVSYSCDVYVLNFPCGVTLMYFKMMISCFFSIFGDLEGLCEMTITPLSIEGYLSEIPIWGVRSFFLSILLSRIIW